MYRLINSNRPDINKDRKEKVYTLMEMSVPSAEKKMYLWRSPPKKNNQIKDMEKEIKKNMAFKN